MDIVIQGTEKISKPINKSNRNAALKHCTYVCLCPDTCTLFWMPSFVLSVVADALQLQTEKITI